MSAASLTLPPLVMEVDGRPLSSAEASSVGEVRVSHRLSLPAQCEVVFFNEPGSGLLDRLVPGTPLRIRVGRESPSLFLGEVTALEYAYESEQGRRILLRGYDHLHRLRKRQPVRTHVQVGLADLARELTSDTAITVRDVPSTLSWRRVIQHGQTDFDLLSEMADASGLYFTLRDDVLYFMTLEGMGPLIPLALGESLHEARIEMNGDSSCRSVVAGAWDPMLVEPHHGRASDARSGRKVQAGVPPRQVGGAEERTLVHQAMESDRHADALAQAELDYRNAQEVVFRGVAEGQPGLLPGARVDIRGVAAKVAGSFVLTEVTHILDNRQRFVSVLSTNPARLTPRSRASSLMLGTVASVDDPEGLGRVQVTLPACNDAETDWMSVMMVGAGANKGLIMLPDVGDRVVVLSAHEDPAQGVVLGGLYGKTGAPDSGVENRSVRRFSCLTPGGQRLRLDDGQNSVRLENSEGSYVELRPDKVVVHAEADLDIEAPGRTLTLRGRAINFEEG